MRVLLGLYGIFFKIGLFTVGGGLAALPLLQVEAFARGWMSKGEFADMIAVSQSTPGPIGVNMATYVGFHQAGLAGSLAATLGIVTPSVLIICAISRFLVHFEEDQRVKGAFLGIRPAVLGLIAVAAFRIADFTLFDLEGFWASRDWSVLIRERDLAVFVLFLLITWRWRRHPLLYIVLAGVVGMLVF